MQGGNKQQFQLSYPIISIQPIQYSTLKILIIVGSIVVSIILLHLLSYKCSILFLLILSFGLAYLHIINHHILLHLFYSIEMEDNEGINKYAINDLSYMTSEEENRQSRKTNHLFIVKVHYVKNKVKYFRFKEDLFKIQDNIVSSINQSDILKVFQINDFKEYLRYGLSDERMKTSIELFKYQSRYTKPSSWDFIKKRIYEQIQYMLVNWFILCTTSLVFQTILTSIVLAIINVVILGRIIYDQSKKVQTFHNKFSNFTNKTFLVYRQGHNIRVNLSEILVGDIIQIQKIGIQDEYMTNFKSLLIGNFEIICKQGANREEFIKSPVRNITDVRQDRKIRYVIQPMSYIEKASLRGSQHLIVMENHSISKFFSLWFQKWSYGEFNPITRQKVMKAIKFYRYGIALLVLFHIIMVIINHTYFTLYQKDILLAILAATCLVPAIIHLLFCFSHHRCLKQLQNHKIQVFGANISPTGAISNIIINFSELLQLQFQQILYKNLIFDPSNRQFEPDSSTLQSGRTYQSLLAIILYLSMGFYDEQQNKSTFLRQIYKIFMDYYRYQDTLDDTKNIVHKATGKMWRLVHKDLQNQQGLRSWRILYEDQLKYILTECNVENQSNLLKYIGTQDQNRMAIYTQLVQSLIQEGKKIKLLMFKSFKVENVNIKGFEDIKHIEKHFIQTDREDLEKNMEFSAFIVFDNALKTENQRIIQFLRDLRNDTFKTFNLSIYSHNKNQNLAGFEHILQYIPIHYSFKSHEKTSLTRQKMHEGGSIVVGSDFDDLYGQLISDLSIRIMTSFENDKKSEKVLTPSDIYVHKLEDIRELLSIGMTHVQYKIEVVKYIFVIWFWVILGWQYVGVLGDNKKIKNSQLWAIILMLFLTFVPLLVKNILDNARNMKNYRKYLDVFTFPFATQLLLNLLISILIIIIIVSQDDICKLQAKNVAETHMLLLRTHNEATQSYNCINLPIILAGSASVLTFSIFFGEENCIMGNILTNFEWWRFFMPIIWFTMMIIAKIPLKIILICIGIVAFMIFIKILTMFIGPSPPEKSLKESQNAETQIE